MKNRDILLADGRTISAIPMHNTGLDNLQQCVEDLTGSYDLHYYTTYLARAGHDKSDVYSLTMTSEGIDKEMLCRFIESCTGVRVIPDQVWKNKHTTFMAGAYFVPSRSRFASVKLFPACDLIGLLSGPCLREALEQPTTDARLDYYYGQVNKYLAASSLRYLIQGGRAFIKFEGAWMLIAKLMHKNWKFKEWLQPIIDRKTRELNEEK